MNYPEKIIVGDRSFVVGYETVLKGTSSVRIKNGKILMKLSRFAVGRQRDEMVEKFLKWAQKRISKMKVGEFFEPEYRDGGRIVFHNAVYDLRIKISARKNNRVLVQEGIVNAYVNEGADLKELIEKALVKEQTAYLREVLSELNQLHFQEKYNWVRFKRMNSRFGSCSSGRNINIAFRLLYAPREVFRYVCVHELAHLKQMNHSKRFWALVSEAMPNYKESEKWLRDSGFLLG